jgi:cyanate permease
MGFLDFLTDMVGDLMMPWLAENRGNGRRFLLIAALCIGTLVGVGLSLMWLGII